MVNVIQMIYSVINDFLSLQVPGIGISYTALICIFVVLSAITWIIRSMAGGGNKE